MGVYAYFPAIRMVPNYTAWRQKQISVNNLPKVTTQQYPTKNVPGCYCANQKQSAWQHPTGQIASKRPTTNCDSGPTLTIMVVLAVEVVTQSNNKALYKSTNL